MRAAVAGFVPLSAANREYAGWLKDKVLKPERKLSLVVTFVSSESARSDQIADLIQELYILNCCTACRFCGVCLFISSEQRVYWWAENRVLKLVRNLLIKGQTLKRQAVQPLRIYIKNQKYYFLLLHIRILQQLGD